MTHTTQTEQATDAILMDLRGAGYYLDVEILSQFLRTQFLPSTDSAAKETAAAIIADFKDAGSYRDRQILAAFLESRLVAHPRNDKL